MTIRIHLSIAAVIAALALHACASSGAPQPDKASKVADGDGRLFEPIHSVLVHPRCKNCHVADDVPLQFDAGLKHAQNVHAGEGKRDGVPGLKCSACHQEQNAPAELGPHAPPGAPNWHLAPVEMVWVDRSAADICQRLRDPASNGGKTAEQLIHHFAEDPLVAWGWAPGGERTLPPLTRAETTAAVEAWIGAGMPCPVDEPAVAQR